MILPDFHLMNPDPGMSLFQPHISVLVSKNMPHKYAYELLGAYLAKSDKQLLTQLWSDFIVPWFGLHEFSGAKAPTTSTVFTPGQRVRTVVGDGQIVSVIKTPELFRYLVKFSFGVGYVNASAVAHLLPNSDMDTDVNVKDATSKLMTDDIQVLFGTERIYLFVRLYILLVTMLYQANNIIDKKNALADNPTANYEYHKIITSLKDLIQGKIDMKDFEAGCRKNLGEDVYNFVAIPLLVESCAEALIKVTREDCLGNLYHCSQLKLKVCVCTLEITLSIECIVRSCSIICVFSSLANRILISYAIFLLT